MTSRPLKAKLLDKSFCETIKNYLLYQELTNFNPDNARSTQGTSKRRPHYGIKNIVCESLLVDLQNKIEDLFDVPLYPTYAYYRVYRKGSRLKQHRDREECDYSCSLNVSTSKWPFYYEGKSITLDQGEAVIYRGEGTHWREPLEEDYCVQIFLHWCTFISPLPKELLSRTLPFVALSS